jgi:DNA-binding NarL/FixJ family response regulator
MKVMIVDDNAMYRSAFKRNLMLMDYEVCEAEHGEEALRVLREKEPDVVVTDLRMRTPTEGLDLIRQIKQTHPLLPVVMISAVGTFEEGAEAIRLGATQVISKSRIDEEIENLYRSIEKAYAHAERDKTVLKEIDSLRPENGEVRPEAVARLRALLVDDSLHSLVRGEAYDALLKATEQEMRRNAEERLNQVLESGAAAGELDRVDAVLRREVPESAQFDPESLKELRAAELFYQRQEGKQGEGAIDLSRNMGFSFCFAVENEAKVRLRKRLHRFLSAPETPVLIRNLMDAKTSQVDLFYHQYLLRLQQQMEFDFTVDNVRQTFQRIMEHESRYKPDGLKALGIMIVCFGREYSFKKMNKVLAISNPLGLRGFSSDEEVLRFAYLLVGLQHYRNPYIHPEITEMEKISKLRDTALECLRQIGRLA